MATKNILLATADLQTVVDIGEALGAEWATTHVASEAEALAWLEAASFEALLVDFNLSSPDASELLNQALEKCPKTTRFLLAYEADLALIAAKVHGNHEILPKPIAPASLKSRIEKGLVEPGTGDEGTATGFDTASTIPSVYDELLQALELPGVTSQQVGEIIASDDGLIQETLMLTRSAWLGLPHKICEPVEAVQVLGLETVKALVLALRFLAEHSHVRPGYISLERIWQHSVRVAQIARDLVLFETKDRALASRALAAGLLHDLGKVVLATNFDDLYGRVHSLARNQPVALWDVEKEMFGASHGEIGACLLGMWNMPGAIVDAAAFHHEPPIGEHDQLTPLAAVHIANVLDHQLQPTDEFRVLPVMNAPFLNQLGLLQRLPVWRAAFANQRSRAQSVETTPVESAAPVREAVAASQTANQLSGPTAETQTATAAPPNQTADGMVPVSPSRWIYTGVLAGLLFALALVLRSELNSYEPLSVHARVIDTPASISMEPSIPLVETAPQPALERVPAAAPAPQETWPADNSSGADPVTVIVPEVVDAGPLPASAPLEPIAPAFRLNGIVYSASRPSAIVNGKIVFIGEEVDGVTVIDIGRDEVTLEVNGERRIVTVPGSEGRY